MYVNGLGVPKDDKKRSSGIDSRLHKVKLCSNSTRRDVRKRKGCSAGQ